MSPSPSMDSEPSRRRTVCTEDGREIVPPQLPFFSWETRSELSSDRAHRVAGPSTMTRAMTIDVKLAGTGQKLRPLPRIPIHIPPAPKSAPPAPPQQFPRSPAPAQQFPRNSSPRPLPSPPDSAYSVSPLTSLFPPTPALEFTSHISSPCTRPGPSAFALKLQTSPDALKPHAFEALESPATPTLPQLPSPRTAQRKRINKLRRHLGESVQMVLDRPDEVDVLARLRHAGNEDSCPVINITVDSVLDFQSTDSDTSSEVDEEDDRVDYFFPSQQASRKWMRERGKARWTEDDFAQVIQDLRAL